MRNTNIDSLLVKRATDYDPDFHGLIDQSGEIHVDLESYSDHSCLFRIRLEFRFVEQDSRRPFGEISVVAHARFEGIEIPTNDDGGADLNSAPENVKRLIEGAIGEDLLLPVAMTARLAKLPSIVPIPLIFPRLDLSQNNTEEE